MRLWLLLLACLASMSAAEAAAAVRPGKAEVSVRMTPEGVRATYRLDRAVTRFAFAAADSVRGGDFEMVTPGLAITEDAVAGPLPFGRFELLIRPMRQERDAKYPAHFRIGGGGVVYAPALLGDPKAWRTRIAYVTALGDVRLPRGSADQGFVFIGPRALLTEDRQISVVADPATPAWLIERARTALAGAVSAYTEALGVPLPRKPLLIVRHQGGERSFNVGDVTPGPVTALRFHGDAWVTHDALAAKAIESFIHHEAFHFWNGGVAGHAEGTPTWLHEGGAEYAALLAGRKSGLLSDGDVAGSLGGALQRCQTGLQSAGDKALGSFAFLPANLRYPCGMAIQWAADLHIRGASGGRRTVLNAWREVIGGAARRKSRQYTLADFYSAAGIASGEALAPIALLVRQSGAERWDALGPALNRLGAEVVQAPSVPGRRAALLFHVLRENCTALPPNTGFGFYTDEGKVKLDAPAGCGVLAGDPPLATVEGGDPFEVPLETYAAVQRKCAAKAPVIFVTADGRTIEAACSKPLAPAPNEYRVIRWSPAH